MLLYKKKICQFSLNTLEHYEQTSPPLIDLSEDGSARTAGSPNEKRPWQRPGVSSAARPRGMYTVDESRKLLDDNEFLDGMNVTESDIEVHFDNSDVSFMFIYKVSLKKLC